MTQTEDRTFVATEALVAPFTVDRFSDGTATVRCRGVVVARRARIWRASTPWGDALTVDPFTVVCWVREGRAVHPD
jgi:hypothetical protein